MQISWASRRMPLTRRRALRASSRLPGSAGGHRLPLPQAKRARAQQQGGETPRAEKPRLRCLLRQRALLGLIRLLGSSGQLWAPLGSRQRKPKPGQSASWSTSGKGCRRQRRRMSGSWGSSDTWTPRCAVLALAVSASPALSSQSQCCIRLAIPAPVYSREFTHREWQPRKCIDTGIPHGW